MPLARVRIWRAARRPGLLRRFAAGTTLAIPALPRRRPAAALRPAAAKLWASLVCGDAQTQASPVTPRFLRHVRLVVQAVMPIALLGGR
jgi:hypothetical protein